MKILLTGHQGFIGSNFLKALHDHEVSTFEWKEPLPNVQGFDWVIHLGAISSTVDRRIEQIMIQNYDFSCWLLDECIKHSVNLQYASSASVYGPESDFRETSPVDPCTPYAWSKYLFERYALRSKHPNIKVQGFRYFNVYGPGEEHKGEQASPYTRFKQQAEKQGYINVFENSENYFRDFIHVDQLIETQLKFLDINSSGIWNIGTGQPRSFLEVAMTFGAPIETVPMPAELINSYQRYTCADLTKLNNTLRV